MLLLSLLFSGNFCGGQDRHGGRQSRDKGGGPRVSPLGNTMTVILQNRAGFQQMISYEILRDGCAFIVIKNDEFLLFTLFVLLFLLLFSLTESLLTGHHLISYDQEYLFC